MAEMPDTITVSVKVTPELSLLIGAAYLAGCEDQASGAVRLSRDGRLARAVEVAERCAFDARNDGANSPEIPDGWECPINSPGCTKNCGSYGCGN